MGASRLNSAIAVYDRIDYIKAMPDSAMAAFGDREQIILASMYRQLAGTPAFLASLEAALAKAASLDTAIAVNRATSFEMSRLIARAIDQSGGIEGVGGKAGDGAKIE